MFFVILLTRTVVAQM